MGLVVVDPEEAVVLLTVLGCFCVPFFKIALFAYRHAATGEADEHQEFKLFKTQITCHIKVAVDLTFVVISRLSCPVAFLINFIERI